MFGQLVELKMGILNHFDTYKIPLIKNLVKPRLKCTSTATLHVKSLYKCYIPGCRRFFIYCTVISQLLVFRITLSVELSNTSIIR